ncbi:hypothetical protein BN85412980 [Alteracholeplasma palmae J233]|uniref:Uncharacterized protein n=1 Tax=Alteracholeplasma palmae (strain ATCC 49389 / J233) TaxID=1318466 RepID=U4KQN2_ALTPJ|nr:hypothetical protein [Alteracholeplasma palmae]CCV64875.1 hypothetical protein BN85412980 [Alteracholeplasma palmae J233]
MKQKVKFIIALFLVMLFSLSQSGSYWANNVLGNDKNSISKVYIGNWLSKKQFIYKELKQSFTTITSGPDYNLAIDAKGNLFGWGANNKGILCAPDDVRILYLPTELPTGLNNEKIVDVSAGFSHALALTESGKLYSWGNNSVGELGLGSNSESVYYEPREVTFFRENNIEIEKIYAGHYASYIVTKSKKVYSWGMNSNGKLCNGSPNVGNNEPQKIEYLDEQGINITTLGIQKEGVVALSDQGELYVWGKNDVNQLGIEQSKIIYTPEKIILPETEIIKKYAVGKDCGLIITQEKNVYVWGKNAYAELGLNHNDIVKKPIKNTDLSNMNIKDAFFSQHDKTATAIITETNEVYTWGFNNKGNLGYRGNDLIIFTPQKILNMVNDDHPNYISISFGVKHTLIQNSEGLIYGMGSDLTGQLGLHSKLEEVLPTAINNQWETYHIEDVYNEYPIDLIEFEANYKKKYTFLGWFLDSKGITLFQESMIYPVENRVLYAKWEIKPL